METQQMRYFITLCEEMNYTKVAERLFITRQALRKAVQNMEEELGERARIERDKAGLPGRSSVT